MTQAMDVPLQKLERSLYFQPEQELSDLTLFQGLIELERVPIPAGQVQYQTADFNRAILKIISQSSTKGLYRRVLAAAEA